MYMYVFLYQYIIYNNFSFERIEERKVLEGIIDTNVWCPLKDHTYSNKPLFKYV